ncbi:unnamed protein product [Cylicocyclus nassatus]|uniref:Uncharacterized protein n=1 Tax=Cylicocyclus nassatus TaxID=53992 RepID=A0AA36M7Z8_CYLNA|nr:unnamed protein product [Cylicocyclus nassatus]
MFLNASSRSAVPICRILKRYGRKKCEEQVKGIEFHKFTPVTRQSLQYTSNRKTNLETDHTSPRRRIKVKIL